MSLEGKEYIQSGLYMVMRVLVRKKEKLMTAEYMDRLIKDDLIVWCDGFVLCTCYSKLHSRNMIVGLRFRYMRYPQIRLLGLFLCEIFI